MARNTQHSLQPRTDHDGNSRRLATLAMKRAVRSTLEAGLKSAYADRVLPALPDEPSTAADVRPALEACPEYRLWAAATRASQDHMWRLLAAQTDGDYPRIRGCADEASAGSSGTLTLDPDFSAPGYASQACIHGQPGGYLLERGDDDLAAGILYEAGGNIYAMGQGIGSRDSKGERLVAHIRESIPGFQPQRILEMGCSAGGQTTDYPAAFPEAEVHALDVSAAMLRFAHARAEALETKVHFHQADAAHTDFPDGSFDLVISHNLFHEVAGEHMPAIMAECHRLLKPGGVCIHQDVPIQSGRFDAWMQFISEWQKEHNDEPFWLDFANADLPEMMKEAGFATETIRADYLQAIDGPIPWYVVSAIR